MSPKNKQLEKHKTSPIISLPKDNQPIIHIPSAYDEKPKLAFPLMIFTIASVLFLLAYAGPDIGNVLAYLVIPAAGFFPGLLVWEKFGKVPGFLAALLVVAVLTPAYGTSVIANSISLFTSLQTISQGVLVLFGITSLVFGIISLLLRARKD